MRHHPITHTGKNIKRGIKYAWKGVWIQIWDHSDFSAYFTQPLIRGMHEVKYTHTHKIKREHKKK